MSSRRARFAFLVHPLIGAQLRIAAARTRRWSLLAGRVDGSDPEDIRPICTLTLELPDRVVEGVVVSIPLLPARILEDQALVLSHMRHAVIQAGGGLDAVGLGSLLAVVAGRGTALQEHLWQPVTTGAAATAWCASENARTAAGAVGAWPRWPIAVLGYSGTVGALVACRLRDLGAERVCVDATGPHARRARSEGLVVAEDPARAVQGCRVVVGASTTGGILRPEALSPGTVLVDVALPPTLAGPPGPGVVVLAGEAVALPRGYRRGGWGSLYHLFAGYGPAHLFACVVEPLLAAAEGRRSPFSQGRKVEMAALEEVANLATRYGFRPVLARRWREVGPAALLRLLPPPPPVLPAPQEPPT